MSTQWGKISILQYFVLTNMVIFILDKVGLRTILQQISDVTSELSLIYM